MYTMDMKILSREDFGRCVTVFSFFFSMYMKILCREDFGQCLAFFFYLFFIFLHIKILCREDFGQCLAFLTIEAQVGFEGGGGEAARGGSTIFFECDVLELLKKIIISP